MRLSDISKLFKFFKIRIFIYKIILIKYLYSGGPYLLNAYLILIWYTERSADV